MPEAQEEPEKHGPLDRSEKIVKRVKNNRYVAPVIAVALISLAILSYIGKVSEAWEKIKGLNGDNNIDKAEKQRALDGQLASYLLGRCISDLERLHPEDEVKNIDLLNQALAETGANLDHLHIQIDYKHLNYGGIYSNGYRFVREQIDLLHNKTFVMLFDFGYKGRNLQAVSAGTTDEDTLSDGANDINNFLHICKLEAKSLVMSDFDAEGEQYRGLNVFHALYALDKQVRVAIESGQCSYTDRKQP